LFFHFTETKKKPKREKEIHFSHLFFLSFKSI